MQFKVNSTLSSKRSVHGGAPQGTRLGNLLFIVTINEIEDPISREVVCEQDGEQLDNSRDCYGLRTLAGRIGAGLMPITVEQGVAVSSRPNKT